MSILSASGCNIISYPKFQNNGVKQLTEEHKKKLQAGKKFCGEITKSSAAKIRKYVNIWIDNITAHNLLRSEKELKADRRMIMLTLTLSADTDMDDKLVKRYLLNTFLTKLKMVKRDFLYIWKAERQKNGRIHFHILADTYFPKDKVSDLWNQTQMHYGIIEKCDLPTARKKYPSTKIEAIRSVDLGLEYMVKYICKQEDNQGISGRVWGCSRGFSELKRITVDDYHGILSRMIADKGVKLVWQSEDVAISIWNMGKSFDRMSWINHINELGLIDLAKIDKNYLKALEMEQRISNVRVDPKEFNESADLGQFEVPNDVLHTILI